MSATTYTIKKMRVVRVSGKIAEKHPERIFTVYGEFYKAGDSNPLSITSKNVDKEDINSPDFSIDLKAATLTISEGQKGRRAVESISQNDIEAELKAIRGN